MKPTVSCPVCGSERLEHRFEERIARVPFGPSTPFQVDDYVCHECNATGDFAAVNDEKIEAAEEKAIQASISAMCEMLASRGVSMAHAERALGLPQRTIARWKAGGHSASGAAVMRIITTYPWMLDVADGAFDPQIARDKLLEQAVHELRAQASEQFTVRRLSDAGSLGQVLVLNKQTKFEVGVRRLSSIPVTPSLSLSSAESFEAKPERLAHYG